MRDEFDYSSMPRRTLFELIAGDKPTTVRHVAAKYELERRASRRASIVSWVAVAISLVSLAVSLFK